MRFNAFPGGADAQRSITSGQFDEGESSLTMPMGTLAHERGSDDEFSANQPGNLMNRQDVNLIEEFNDEMLDDGHDLEVETQFLLERMTGLV